MPTWRLTQDGSDTIYEIHATEKDPLTFHAVGPGEHTRLTDFRPGPFTICLVHPERAKANTGPAPEVKEIPF